MPSGDENVYMTLAKGQSPISEAANDLRTTLVSEVFLHGLRNRKKIPRTMVLQSI